MKIYLILLFTIMIFGCDQSKTNQQKAEETVSKDSTLKYDFLKWEDLKINGEIPLFTNQKEVNEKLGKLDSISATMDDCGMYFWHRDYKKIYYKGIEFEATTDSLVFRSIDFRESNAFLSTPKFRLDKTTTTADLQKYFPNSFNRKFEREIYGVGFVKIMHLNINDDYLGNENWTLFFDDKKLIRIDYWISC